MPSAFDFLKGPRGTNGIAALIECLLGAIAAADEKDKPMQIMNDVRGSFPSFSYCPVSIRRGSPVLPDYAAIICYPDGRVIIHDPNKPLEEPEPKRMTKAEMDEYLEGLRAKSKSAEKTVTPVPPKRKQVVPAKRKQVAPKLNLQEEDSARKPSEEKEFPWIYAVRKVGDYPRSTKNNGKWLVFVPSDEIDEMWAKIKQATEEGRLGAQAKSSTALEGRYDSDEKVICVYTYDWTDEEDVRRIRQELRQLGVTRKIAYKSDEDTRSGKYRSTGHTKISKYYE